MSFKERIADAGYQKVISDIINEFFKNAGDVELYKILRTEASLDAVEVMIRYLSDKSDIEKNLVTMFALGVYMASKNDAILPTNIQ